MMQQSLVHKRSQGRLIMERNGSVLNSQYEGRVRSYVRGKMKRACRKTEHVRFSRDKSSHSRCSSLDSFSSEEDL